MPKYVVPQLRPVLYVDLIEEPPKQTGVVENSAQELYLGSPISSVNPPKSHANSRVPSPPQTAPNDVHSLTLPTKAADVPSKAPSPVRWPSQSNTPTQTLLACLMKRDVVGILRDFQRVAENELNLRNKDGSLFPISSSNLLRYLRYIRFSAKNLSRVISALSTHHSHGPTWKQNINNNPDILEYLCSRPRNDTSTSQSMKIKDLLRPELPAPNGSITQRPALDTPFTNPLKPNGFPQVAKKSTTPFIIPVHLEKSKLRHPIRRENTPRSVSPTMSMATSDNKTVTALDESPSSSPSRSSEPIGTSIKRARYSETPLERVSKRARQDSPDPIELQISTSKSSVARRNLRPRKQQNYSPTSNRHQIIDDLSDFVTVSPVKKGTKVDVNHARVEIANTLICTDSEVDRMYETIEEIEKRYLDNCEHHQYCAIYGNWHLPLKPSLIFLWATEILSPRGRATIEDPPHLPLFMDQSNWQHILDTTPSKYEIEDANPSSKTSQLENVKFTSSSTKSHISTPQASLPSSQTSVKSDLRVKKESSDKANLLLRYPPVVQANSPAQKSASIRPSASPLYPKSLLWLARKSTT